MANLALQYLVEYFVKWIAMLRAYLQLIRWDKPIGSLLLLWPTWWGLWLANHGMPLLKIWLVFSLGVFLTRSAGCAMNDFADSKFDGMVERTSKRPLVTGVLSRKNALALSASLSLVAFGIAWACLKPITLVWSLPAVGLLISYPFLKRFFPLPQLYLGVAFSFGIPMAYIEIVGHVPNVAWLLFGANCAWVMAYDTIYALVDIEDDSKLGLKTSALTFGRHVVLIIMLCYALFWFGMGLVGVLAHLKWWFFIGLALEIPLIYRVYQQIYQLERQQCFQAFLFNNMIGLLMFIALALNYI